MYATTKVAEMFILTHMQRKETRGEAQCMWAGSIWYTTTPIRMPRISVLMPSRPLPPQPIRAQAPAVHQSQLTCGSTAGRSSPRAASP